MTSRSSQSQQVRSTRGLQTPESLLGQRVEVPSLDDQLAEYEARRAMLDDAYEEIDPNAAQGVYLLVAGILGVVAAGAMAVPMVLLLYAW